MRKGCSGLLQQTLNAFHASRDIADSICKVRHWKVSTVSTVWASNNHLNWKQCMCIDVTSDKPTEHKHAKLTGAQMKTSFCLLWPSSFFYQLHYTMHLNHLNIWCVNLQHIISVYKAKLPALHPNIYKLQLFPDWGKFHILSASLLAVTKRFARKKLLYFVRWEKGWERKICSVRATGSEQHASKSSPSYVTYRALQRGHHKLQNSSQAQQPVGAGEIVSTADGFGLRYHQVDTMSL